MPASLDARRRSDERAVIAKRLRAEGMSYRAIAARVGIGSPTAVYHLIHKPEPEPGEDRGEGPCVRGKFAAAAILALVRTAEAVRLRDQGMSQREIASAMGWNRDGVRTALTRRPRLGPPVNPDLSADAMVEIYYGALLRRRPPGKARTKKEKARLPRCGRCGRAIARRHCGFPAMCRCVQDAA